MIVIAKENWYFLNRKGMVIFSADESSEQGKSCYITYDMDFWFVPSDPVCFDKLSRYDK